jgi:hypothetical protein
VLNNRLIGFIALAAALSATIGGAAAFDETRYPDWKGQWRRAEGGPPRYDPSKPVGLGQQAPLTEEYRAIHAASMADQAAGGHGNDPTFICVPPGMPRVMNVFDSMEIVITPEVTRILIQAVHDSRRIFTDGRPWPQEINPSYAGYSIGTWVDTDGDGRYDMLEVETRGFRGSRAFDETGLPLHEDNETVIKERIYSDKVDPSLLHDEITTIDHALTRPWTATKTYRRVATTQPVWREAVCSEGNLHVEIDGKSYFLSADGLLMPTRKDQEPPDVKHFNSK